MRNILFLVSTGVALVVGVAQAFPELRPNCPVVGNWTDPEGTKYMWVSHIPHEGGAMVTQEMALNTSRTFIHHALTRPANNSILGTPTTPLVYYPSNVTRPDGHVERESVVVQARCVNDLLWVKVIPVTEESIYGHITSFTLRRLALPVLSEAPPPPPPPPPSPPPPQTPPSAVQPLPGIPQFILVNVTFPSRQEDHQYQEDDNLNYIEVDDFLQRNRNADPNAEDDHSSVESLLERGEATGTCTGG